jgi:hypothetical protein
MKGNSMQKQRSREEILKHIDQAANSPAISPAEELSRMRHAQLETLLDIRDGVNRMLDSGMYDDHKAERDGKLPPRR